MSRLGNPGCMLRIMSAMFGAIFLPVGVSFFFIMHHRHWLQGVGAVAASLGFFYIAYRADDLLNLDAIPDTSNIRFPEVTLPPPLEPPRPPVEPPPSAGESEP